MSTKNWVLFPMLLTSAVGCMRQGDLTGAEARESVAELEVSSQSEALSSNTVEISTNFKIGKAVADAAAELKSFVASQLPCADVTVTNNHLKIEYGAKGLCPAYHGHVLSGTHEVTISRNEESEVLVDHAWTDLSNGKFELNGTANVTWDLADPSRHIEHDLLWKRLSDGRTGEGKGSRTQRALNGDITQGFTEDGNRSWKGQAGQFDLDIDQLAMRWTDPVPESGALTLDTPYDKTVKLTFKRLAERTIRVTVAGPRHSIDIDVNSTD